MSRVSSTSPAHPPRDRGADFFATQARHVRQCLREGLVAAALWFVGFVWVVSAMVTRGYVPDSERPAEPQLLLGMPSWVVWGLFVPWLVQIAAAWWFAICWLKDDEPYQDFPAER